MVRMRDLADNSVQTVCCDPPYGLEFMGKDWDHLDVEKPKVREDDSGGTIVRDLSDVGGFQDSSGGNAFSRSRIRFRQPKDKTAGAQAQQKWHEAWLTKAFRVLIPGGRIKVFGGTRVYHRLAAAMEAVGFTDITFDAWAYGSGFPKSLNVGKAIDKRPGAVQNYLPIKLFLAAAIKDSPKTRNQIDAECGFAACDFARTKGTSPFVGVIPDAAKWAIMQSVIGFNDTWDDAVQEAEREVVGQGKSGTTAIWTEQGSMGDFDITAAASDPAKVWAGWGTALKPAWEPVLIGVKPC